MTVLISPSPVLHYRINKQAEDDRENQACHSEHQYRQVKD
jgi:hypothetical protein